VGSEETGNCGAISRRGGVIREVAAHAGGGGGGQSGFRRKKTAGRLTGRACLSVRGRRWGWLAGPEGGGREVGCGWAGRGRKRGRPRLGRKSEMARFKK
jgi:hypothetical protein